MTRLFGSLRWFLLVPYFAVAALNVPPWIGETRKSANRTNAQLTLALLIISPALFALAGTGRLIEGFPRERPYLFSFALLLPALLFVNRWLRSDREAKYQSDYAAMPRSVRVGFGLGTLALFCAAFWLFVLRG